MKRCIDTGTNMLFTIIVYPLIFLFIGDCCQRKLLLWYLPDDDFSISTFPHVLIEIFYKEELFLLPHFFI